MLSIRGSASSEKYAGKARKAMAKLEQDVQAFVVKQQGIALDILKQHIENVFNLSQEEVPVDKGFLKASGQWEVSVEGSTITGTVSYGCWVNGKLVDYAVYVHEGVNQPPGNAKYLERPVMEDLNRLESDVTQKMKV